MRYIIAISFLLLSAGIYDTIAQKPSKRLTVTGTVTDANNNPVAGAIIMINNKKIDQTTDRNGFFRIKTGPSDTLMTVFMMNGGLKEEKLDGRSVINFRLAGIVSRISNPQTRDDEQEYNVGYGTIKKRDMTTSVGKIDGSNMKYASYSNIYDMIKGEVPGVQVAGKKITIQGPSSINLSTDPLIIVNGIETSNIDDISPQMVKSIEVLKGSSASIYGSRGANGVLIITLIGSGRD